MFELFENLTNWLWGLPLLITILATGVYLTVRSGFFQFRHFGYIVKNMFSKERRQEGGDDGKSLTPFQAISIAIGEVMNHVIKIQPPNSTAKSFQKGSFFSPPRPFCM